MLEKYFMSMNKIFLLLFFCIKLIVAHEQEENTGLEPLLIIK